MYRPLVSHVHGRIKLDEIERARQQIAAWRQPIAFLVDRLQLIFLKLPDVARAKAPALAPAVIYFLGDALIGGATRIARMIHVASLPPQHEGQRSLESGQWHSDSLPLLFALLGQRP
ncbi:hypothetical protein MES5069_920015 [Mesorhizobium escarrei]|uniref:Uncharacterized protein n=1 Tax=Mesorhizobium escarrei TaxID=666018 RepID=A0ABN8KHA4_9HYPH|nr:hypothetical protein MES5069_920015 [Mesorhizobium escarrei]